MTNGLLKAFFIPFISIAVVISAFIEITGLYVPSSVGVFEVYFYITITGLGLLLYLNSQETPTINKGLIEIILGSLFITVLELLTFIDFSFRVSWLASNTEAHQILVFFAITAGLIIIISEALVSSTHFRIEREVPVDGDENNLLDSRDWKYTRIFILFALVFLATRLALPFIYAGSYIDEYNHILSGIAFFKAGHFAQIYVGQYYSIGEYVSFLVGLYMRIFGENIFAAKLVPLTIGIVDFFLLSTIGRHCFKNKWWVLALASIYTTVPWFIFNDFYIRVYIFYELFLLLLTLLFIKFVQGVSANKKRELVWTATFTVFTLAIVEFLSSDGAKYLILLYACVLSLYIYFFKLQKIDFSNNTIKFLCRNTRLKIALFSFAILAFLILFKGLVLIAYLQSGSASFTSGSSLKYSNLFFHLNTIFTILFFCSFGLLFLKETKEYVKPILVAALVLFLVHYFSSPDLQLTRIIIYFLPLFYLLSLLALEKIVEKIRLNKSFFLLVMITVLSCYVYLNYPPAFFSSGPYIPTEVSYKEYAAASLYTNQIATSGTVLITNFPQIYEFYAPNSQAKIYLMRDNSASFYNPGLEYEGFFGHEYFTSTNDQIITSPAMLQDIIARNQNVILLLDQNLSQTWTSPQSAGIMNENFSVVEQFQSLAVYERK